MPKRPRGSTGSRVVLLKKRRHNRRSRYNYQRASLEDRADTDTSEVPPDDSMTVPSRPNRPCRTGIRSSTRLSNRSATGSNDFPVYAVHGGIYELRMRARSSNSLTPPVDDTSSVSSNVLIDEKVYTNDSIPESEMLNSDLSNLSRKPGTERRFSLRLLNRNGLASRAGSDDVHSPDLPNFPNSDDSNRSSFQPNSIPSFQRSVNNSQGSSISQSDHLTLNPHTNSDLVQPFCNNFIQHENTFPDIFVECDDFNDSSEIFEHSAGTMESFCAYCGANYFKGEMEKGTYKKCCNDGQYINLNKHLGTPDVLRNLLQGTHPKSNQFFKHIRRYNNSLALASTSFNQVKFDGSGW